MRSSWHVATAAEAIAAAQFARCGWGVSVQYGANQPEYDLMAAGDDGTVLKVSVKGSKDGRWGLTQSHLNNANYHAAANGWLASHRPRSTVLCLVQFKGVSIDELPRVYLVWPFDVAGWLKRAAGGRGDTILYEHHRWGPRARSAGAVDQIPREWAFDEQRLQTIATEANSNDR